MSAHAATSTPHAHLGCHGVEVWLELWLTNMADDIDFLSGSCKQDVTDLICLSAHLNLNRRLEAGERQRLREVRSEGMRVRLSHTRTHTNTHTFWLAYLQLKWATCVLVAGVSPFFLVGCFHKITSYDHENTEWLCERLQTVFLTIFFKGHAENQKG